MSQELLNKAVQSSMKTDVPSFAIGDTVSVAVRIIEGDKERLQHFEGTVIARNGGGIHETFTVRRIVANQGVERIFPLHSPKVADIQVIRRGKVRRAKLFYLRQRVGKATRIKEKKESVQRHRQRRKESAGQPVQAVQEQAAPDHSATEAAEAAREQEQ